MEYKRHFAADSGRCGKAPIRRSVVRILPGLRPEDIDGVKMEAVCLALDSGAAFGGVDVFLEIDQNTARVSAVAVGLPVG